jgi:hypothetical protein
MILTTYIMHNNLGLNICLFRERNYKDSTKSALSANCKKWATGLWTERDEKKEK